MRKTPKLRFPEFSGEWKEYSIGEIFDFYTTNSYSRDCLNYDKGTVKNIHYGDIHMKFSTILDVIMSEIPYINEDIDLNKISEDCYCKEGDVVIADASENYDDIGKSIEIKNIGSEKIVAGLHTLLARDNKGITQNGYRGYMLLSNNVRKQIKILAVGSKVLGISKANINKISVYVPEKKEQQKLASFFLLIDQKINKKKEKVKCLQQYKKGMMQKIFSQEIRFKDENGKEYPEWQTKKLGEITEKTGVKNKNNDQYDVYSISNKHGFIPQNEQFEDSRLSDLDKSMYQIVGNGEFAYNPARINVGSLGVWEGNNKVIVSSLYVCFKFKDNLDYKFFNTYFSSFQFHKDVIRNLEGSVREYLFYENFSRIKVSYPIKEEQEKISGFFDVIDIKIAKEEEKLESLNEWKKGLLQQMFV